MKRMHRWGSQTAALGLVGLVALLTAGLAAGAEPETPVSLGGVVAFDVPSPKPPPKPSAFPTSVPTSVPTPVPATHRPRPVPHGPGGSMAETGSHTERLWLLGGLALALAATGAVAKAAMRGRPEN
ncbi:hypothetical protein ACF06X_18355 [Streptomyces sp. NPDC015346]|uniref:hypothetical protein n=1 Tax=Streptomyces sp. NPDC015346 TaxID=3364954 RepID=UPI0036FFFAD7